MALDYKLLCDICIYQCEEIQFPIDASFIRTTFAEALFKLEKLIFLLCSVFTVCGG